MISYFIFLLLLISSSSASSKDKDNIDKILHVDTSPTQLVVVTSKEGAIENLSVKIELTDIVDGRSNPPFIASGLWILVNRGRYTIPFLRPDRWYGVHYTSERGFGDDKITHTEYRLVKTPPKLGNGVENTQSEDKNTEEAMFDVSMHRAGPENTENVEGIYVTVKWITKERINGSELAVDLRVKCDSSIANEDIVLPFNQEGVTVEIAMDHKYELEEVNTTMHQMMAVITPLRCHQICWRPWLRTTSDSMIFSRDYGEQCHDVGGTTSVTFLRNFKYYTLKDGVLIVETEHHKSGEIDEGYVNLSALPLGIKYNDTDPIQERFNTEQTDGKFALPLPEAGYYAIKYAYTKVKPFHYSTEERFLVESAGFNSSGPINGLVELKYEPYLLVKDPKRYVQESPSVFIHRPIDYEGVDADVYVEPFCGMKQTHIKLSDDNQHYELSPTHLKKALCARNNRFYFCEHKANEDSSAEKVDDTSSEHLLKNSTDSIEKRSNRKKTSDECGPLICYTVEVEIDNEKYAMGSRCSDITQHFDMDTVEVNHSSSTVIPILLFVFTLYFI